MEKIFLIFGGKSAEHDISILTASNVIKHINFQKYCVQPIYISKQGTWLSGEVLHQSSDIHDDVLFLNTDNATVVLPTVIKEENAIVFPLLHGPNGEDGTIQGLFEMLDIPYVGAGVLASACGMDKIMSKKIFAQEGLPQVPYVAIVKHKWEKHSAQILKECQEKLHYPLFVKPANMGSSVGVSKVNQPDELSKAIEKALSFDRRVLVETGVQQARELEVGVLGYPNMRASVVGEVVKVVDFYDFEEKYENNQATLQIPAQISEEISQILQQYAIRAVEALDISGLTRCDFFLTQDNQVYINEVNTLPGFTQYSMYPLLWDKTGVSYSELIEHLIQCAKERHNEKALYQQVNK
ncbi:MULTISPECIES: D-alanine--D-alanine ligase [unclassified Granulicatella]|uniref:D-alanine--D-alanine ligase n=1 Tax=unclassified Granulicatella TaxID=2630493 RepID=UPI001073DFDF|nr:MULTISPECIES: D-alanine--D-alanine ligase [unclassified Granulicatella]MBF0779608.1 D-alanine--D-alanine ligase [Granulicatella sp. 19428wC4_WM01]TFU96407.1 D-alanine--D-alanine ligase [Granulicatella sp. WM01]